MNDRLLLLAFVATQSNSITVALETLAQQEAVPTGAVLLSKDQTDVASWRFCVEAGLGDITNPADRITLVRNYVTENLGELEALTERLPI